MLVISNLFFLQNDQVYREFYPEIEGFVTLECEWRIDKFVLLERTNKSEIRDPEGDGQDASVRDSSVQYNSLESFLGGKSSFNILLAILCVAYS